MPKDRKPQSFWRNKLAEFAKSSAPTLGREEAPRKGSQEHKTYERIKSCPKRKGETQMQLFSQGTVNCTCGYHVQPQSQQGVRAATQCRGTAMHAASRAPRNPYLKLTTPRSPYKKQSVPKNTYQKQSSPRPLTIVPGVALESGRQEEQRRAEEQRLEAQRLAQMKLPHLTGSLPEKPKGFKSISDVRNVTKVVKEKGCFDLHIFGPTDGSCIYCGVNNMKGHNQTNVRMAYTPGLPCFVQGVHLMCVACSRFCRSFDSKYVMTLPVHRRTLPFFFHGSANGVSHQLIKLLRQGMPAKSIEHFARAELTAAYENMKSKYQHESVQAVQLGQARGYSPFPSLPDEFCPKSPALNEAFIADYCIHKDDLLRELKGIVSTYALAVDHKRGDVKRVAMNAEKGDIGTQSFTIVGDLGLVLNYCIVPDTHGDWTDVALDEVVDRHGEACPGFLYVDCNCCNNKLSSDAKKKLEGSAGVEQATEEAASASDKVDNNMADGQAAGRWRKKLKKVLDAMHLMNRIGRQMNMEHPRATPFMTKLSAALYHDSKEDTEMLESTRKKFGMKLTQRQIRSDRQRLIRHTVGDSKDTTAHVLALLKLELELDGQCKEASIQSGRAIENITVADPAYPLITKKVSQAVLQQCVHLLNGCVQSDGVPYVCIGEVNYRQTGVMLKEYQYLCGTSRVEALHSVSERHFYSFNQIRTILFDAKALWMVINYNRGRLMKAGKPTLPLSLAPAEASGAILARNAKGLYFGFDYARKVVSDLEEVCIASVLEGLCHEKPDDQLTSVLKEDVKFVEDSFSGAGTSDEKSWNDFIGDSNLLGDGKSSATVANVNESDLSRLGLELGLLPPCDEKIRTRADVGPVQVAREAKTTLAPAAAAAAFACAPATPAAQALEPPPTAAATVVACTPIIPATQAHEPPLAAAFTCAPARAAAKATEPTSTATAAAFALTAPLAQVSRPPEPALATRPTTKVSKPSPAQAATALTLAAPQAQASRPPEPALAMAAALSKKLVHGISSIDSSWIDGIDELIARPKRAKPRRDVARRRNLGGQVLHVTPDYNEAMKEVWDRLWAEHNDCQGGVKSKKNIVQDCLIKYREIQTSNIDLANVLMPTTYAMALQYLEKKTASQGRQLKSGNVNKRALDMNDDFRKLVESRRISNMPQGRAIEDVTIMAQSATQNKRAVSTVADRQPDLRKEGCAGRNCGHCGAVLTNACDTVHRQNCPLRLHVFGQAKSQAQQEKEAELKRRKSVALEYVRKKGLIIPGTLPRGMKRCGVCSMIRDKDSHVVLNNMVLYCPLADPPELKQKILDDRKKRKKK